jgi:GNAT superfamily N-acetyltransferase
MSDAMVDMRVRAGGPHDVGAVLALLDGATRWLVACGRPEQWGTSPQSRDPRRVGYVRRWAAAGELWLAQCTEGRRTGAVRGAIALGQANPHVPAATEPELYVNLLVTDRSYAGRGVGRLLLDHAGELARARGLTLLRVDCYRGPDRALVRYYQGQGFTPTERFTVRTGRGPWPGQILEQRLEREPAMGQSKIPGQRSAQ